MRTRDGAAAGLLQRVFCRCKRVGGSKQPGNALVTFGDSYLSTDGKLMEEPWMLDIIRLDGSDGGLVHYIGEATPEELKIGMKMEAVFKEKREGNILDIKYFRPLKE